MARSSLTNVYIPISTCSSRNGRRICKITPHHMAGNLSLETCARVLENNDASANYCIDSQGRIACLVDEDYRSWCSSSYDNDSQAITIEVANDEIGGNWHVSDAALESLIKLGVDICQRYGFRMTYDGTPNASLTRHNMFASTTCPGPYLQSRFPDIAGEINRRLDGGQPTPTPTPTSNVIAQYQQWLNNQYGFNLAVDGIYGYDTNLKGVMALQLEYNAQWGAGLNVDGIMGPATKAASPVLYVGCQGNITRNVQYMLEIKGFSTGSYGVDGIYGNGTANAVRSYQASRGLSADGLCGPETFYSLY
jgi:hypothetical protein